MENIEYLYWLIVIVLTILFFNYFSKKYKSLASLLPLVLIPVWIITAILSGAAEIYNSDTYNLFSLIGFVGLMAGALPRLVLFGGITFSVMYIRFKKKQG